MIARNELKIISQKQRFTLMKPMFKIILFICLCLLFLSSCKTRHHAGNSKYKKHKKKCDCPKFSYHDSFPEHTYVLKIN